MTMSQDKLKTEVREPNTRLGVGLAVGGWALAAIPIMALIAYIRVVDDCAPTDSTVCPSSTESGSIPMVILTIACMVLGPIFLGVAAATKKRWARLGTVMLALPVVFVGYDLLSDKFL